MRRVRPTPPVPWILPVSDKVITSPTVFGRTGDTMFLLVLVLFVPVSKFTILEGTPVKVYPTSTEPGTGVACAVSSSQ
jgi:hypothetical protein